MIKTATPTATPTTTPTEANKNSAEETSVSPQPQYRFPQNGANNEGNELEGLDDDIEKSSVLLEWNCTLRRFDELSKTVISKAMRSMRLKSLQITQLRNQNKALITQNTVNIIIIIIFIIIVITII